MPVACVKLAGFSFEERLQTNKEKNKNETKAVISLLCTLAKIRGVALAQDLHIFKLEKTHL